MDKRLTQLCEKIEHFLVDEPNYQTLGNLDGDALAKGPMCLGIDLLELVNKYRETQERLGRIEAMLADAEYVQFDAAYIAPVLNGPNADKWYIEDTCAEYDTILEAYEALKDGGK